MEGLELDRVAVLVALADGRRLGCRLATLVSTPVAWRLYERLGFRPAATLRQSAAG